MGAIGCVQRNCYLKQHDVANLRSSSFESAQLTFCYGGTSPGKKTAKVSSRGSAIELNAYNADNRKSRIDGSCEDNHLVRDEYTYVPVALTSESFNDAKLCYFDAEKTSVAIVDPTESCPSGSVEQTEPVDDCLAPF